ncbi:MAG: hypothetical protein K0R31_537 [Clostridiales bacterium]|jgi:hypothetical protein|nr:hypothetical protein [Clostridiales bacterium]
MLTFSDLNYLFTQKIPIKIFSEDEKAIIYYENTDTVPAKAFARPKENRNDVIKYIKNFVRNIFDRRHIPFTTGVYKNITDIVLKG